MPPPGPAPGKPGAANGAPADAASHGDSSEQPAVAKQVGPPPRPPKEEQVTLRDLFRYATPLDLVLLVTGALASLATGCVKPINFIFSGAP